MASLALGILAEIRTSIAPGIVADRLRWRNTATLFLKVSTIGNGFERIPKMVSGRLPRVVGAKSRDLGEGKLFRSGWSRGSGLALTYSFLKSNNSNFHSRV
jgi:hypothetical protein